MIGFVLGAVFGAVAALAIRRWWAEGRTPEPMDDPVILFRDSGLL